MWWYLNGGSFVGDHVLKPVESGVNSRWLVSELNYSIPVVVRIFFFFDGGDDFNVHRCNI